MHKRLIKVGAAIAGLMAAILTTGCSVGTTQADQVGLHYSGGSFSAQKFQDCFNPSSRVVNGPGDHYYYYPHGQRTFSFTGRAGSEVDPITVATSDGQQVKVPGYVAFTLNTNCDVLRQFHEQIGLKYKAYMDDKDQTSDGWQAFLNDYLETPLISVMNRASTQFTWRELYNDSATQTKFENYVKENLPGAVASAIGQKYISVDAVQISKPIIPQGLVDGLALIQENELKQQAQEQLNKANITKYQTIKDCQEKGGLTAEQCLTYFMIQDGSIKWVVPQGTGVNVPVN